MSTIVLTKQVTFASPKEPFDTSIDVQDVSLQSKNEPVLSSKTSLNSNRMDVRNSSSVDHIKSACSIIDSPFQEFDYTELLPEVPDGGWGWIVCLGSFTINFILDGTLFSFGILMIALQNDLGHSKSLTACIGSTQMGLHMIMGPVISALLLRYSIRQVTLAGSLICSFGFISSFFAPNIYVLIFTYGVIAGIGIGMVFLPAIIVVGVYFNQKRAIATGIGTFCFAYITSELLEAYHWRGTLLILGGIVLNCFVCGMLFRPLHPDVACLDEIEETDSSNNSRCEQRFYSVPCCHDNRSTASSPRSTGNTSGCLYFTCCDDVLMCSHDVEAEVTMFNSQTYAMYPIFKTSQVRAVKPRSLRNLRKSSLWRGRVLDHVIEVAPVELSDLELNNARGNVACEYRLGERAKGQGDKDLSTPTANTQERKPILHAGTRTFTNHQKVQFPRRNGDTNNKIIPTTILLRGKTGSRFPGQKYRILNGLDLNDNRSSFKKHSTSGRLKLSNEPSLSSMSATKIDQRHYSVIVHRFGRGLTRPIMRKDIFYGGSISIENNPEFVSMATFLAALTKTSEDEGTVQVISKGSKFKQAFNQLCPLRLLRNKVFILLLITFTMWTAQSVSMTYLPYLAMSIGIDQSDASFLISIVGVANLIGRLLAGLITDCLGIPSIWLYVLALSTAAVINFYIPFCDSLLVLQFCSAIFGLCMAVSVSLRTIVLAQQLGIEALTESFGLVAFFQGVAYSINPPVAGKLIDDLKSYNPAFVMASLMYIVSALSSLGVGFLSLINEEEILYRVDSKATPDLSGQQSVEYLGRDSWHWTRDFLKSSSKKKSFGILNYDEELFSNLTKKAMFSQKALGQRSHPRSGQGSPSQVSPTFSADRSETGPATPTHSSLKQASHRRDSTLAVPRTVSFSSVKYVSSPGGSQITTPVLPRSGSPMSITSIGK